MADPRTPRMPIDWALLDSVTAGDRKAADEMLQEFHAVMPGYRLAVENALAEGNLVALVGIAHRYRGTVSMLGARVLAEAFARLQAAAAAGDADAVQRTAREALEEWECLSIFLQTRGVGGGTEPESSPAKSR